MTTTSETIRELDTLRRKHGADSDIGFAASNLIELLKALPHAEPVPDKPEGSTIDARANLLDELPKAQEHLARVMGEQK